MRVSPFHRWDVTPREAVRIQKDLHARVVPRGRLSKVHLIAGADTAFDKASDTAFAAVVVLSFPGLEVVEERAVRTRVSFPYVPGLLSFREAPPLLGLFRKLRHDPDLVFIDGHGFAHPRRAGIACHIGVFLDRPVIGCAKSLLVGTYREPGARRGSVSDLVDKHGQVIGAVVRTQDGVKPVFVSVGHRISLKSAVRLTLACAPKYRIPEPTRLADILAARAKREGG